jgi:threonine dehydrogenase-like Zn-dependent dehydrogenase
MKLNKYQLAEARDWLKDITFEDADDDDIDEATDEEIERVVKRCWDGGIDAFIDCVGHEDDTKKLCRDVVSLAMNCEPENEEYVADGYTEEDELIATYGVRNYEFVKERDWCDDSLDTYLGKHDNTELNEYMENIMPERNTLSYEGNITFSFHRGNDNDDGISTLKIIELDEDYENNGEVHYLATYEGEIASNTADFLFDSGFSQQEILNHLVAGSRNDNFTVDSTTWDSFSNGFDSEFNLYFEG